MSWPQNYYFYISVLSALITSLHQYSALWELLLSNEGLSNTITRPWIDIFHKNYTQVKPNVKKWVFILIMHLTVYNGIILSTHCTLFKAIFYSVGKFPVLGLLLCSVVDPCGSCALTMLSITYIFSLLFFF